MINTADILHASILIVDDVEANVRLLERMLLGVGYTTIASTTDPHAVCELYRHHRYDLILLDIQMPGMDGFQVMEGLKEIETDGYLPVLIITAQPDHKLRALQAGAKDFISKPFDLAEVRARVNNLLEVRLLHLETKHYSIKLQQFNDDLQRLVQAQVREISDAQLATILAMSKLAEKRDDDTGKHLERTRAFCQLLAKQLQTQPAYATVIDDAFIDNIFHASPLHDIGKVAIPDKILLKPGKLTPDEFAIIQTHTTHGAATLQSVHDRYPHNIFISMGIQVARAHHEKWDGGGYPDGLCEEAIPLSAQIMAVADVYDALRIQRCYKEAFPRAQSREIMTVERGKHFAPALVDAFLILETQFDALHTQMVDK